MVLIKNGRVMDPKSGLDQVCDVLVEGKKIVKIGQNLKAADAQVLDASGLVVAPHQHIAHLIQTRLRVHYTAILD